MTLRLGTVAPDLTGRSNLNDLPPPGNWRHGDDVIILASFNDEQAREQLPDGWRAERPYLRYVPDLSK